MKSNLIIKIEHIHTPSGPSFVYRFIYVYIANNFENLLVNHWPEYFLNWHGAFLGQRYLVLFK